MIKSMKESMFKSAWKDRYFVIASGTEICLSIPVIFPTHIYSSFSFLPFCILNHFFFANLFLDLVIVSISSFHFLALILSFLFPSFCFLLFISFFFFPINFPSSFLIVPGTLLFMFRGFDLLCGSE